MSHGNASLTLYRPAAPGTASWMTVGLRAGPLSVSVWGPRDACNAERIVLARSGTSTTSGGSPDPDLVPRRVPENMGRPDVEHEPSGCSRSGGGHLAYADAAPRGDMPSGVWLVRPGT